MLRHRVVTVLMVIAAMIATAIPAGAQDMYLSKTSGRAASGWWQQVDGTPTGTEFGNFHFVELYVYEITKGVGNLNMWVSDFDCEEGETPYGDYDGGLACDPLGYRYFDGQGIPFTMDKKLSSALLSGEASVFQVTFEDEYYQEVYIGSAHLDVSWTGFGNTFKNTSTWKWSDGISTSSGRYSSTDRQATLSGHAGDIEIDPATSYGYMSIFRDMYKSRSK